MESNAIPQSLGEVAFEAPISGQSLTNSPDNNYAWEQQPQMVDLGEARQEIFLNLLKPEKLVEVQKLMVGEVPIDAIAQTLLVEGFRKGKFNPDLALQLLEPTMYMLLAIAEKSGIEPTLNIEDEEPDEDEALQMVNDSKTFMAEGGRFQDAQVINPQATSVGGDIKKQLDNLDVEKMQASILQKPKPDMQQQESLLGKTGV
jgi:hypothetical protein|tara:strand:+ start:398 stop:1003 length:606 start_codon:yes stop_codon:yes gene_type:complete